MAALSIFRNSLVSKIVRKNIGLPFRLIATSGNKKEANESCPSFETVYKKVPDFSKPLENKNWVSFGFSETNQGDDFYYTHLFFFISITVIYGGCIFSYLYYPDWARDDWAQREAFIRLYEREQLGLDPVDKNYVDPSKVILPPDEELDDDDIII